MWTLNQIWIYPIKSLPGLSVSQSEILPAGNLRHDREFALVDAGGRFVNGKRFAEIHRIRATWDLQAWRVGLSSLDSPDPTWFHLDVDREALGEWFSHFLGLLVRIEQRHDGGFPDDLESPGPTVISTATLNAVAQWFPGLTVDEIRRRFRTNLEIDGTEPFGEDRLFGGMDQTVEFTIGQATLFGNNPCQRCVVPTRTSDTGEIWPLFQRSFAAQRQKSLPSWVNSDRFNHFYRLAVNTRISSTELQPIHTGDLVRIVE